MNPIDLYRLLVMTISGILLWGWTAAEPGSQLLVSGIGGFLVGAGIFGLVQEARR